jgi:hypothetical protein
MMAMRSMSNHGAVRDIVQPVRVFPAMASHGNPLVDCLAREDDRPHPNGHGWRSAEAASFLGELIGFAEKKADDDLHRFLARFDALAEPAITSLRVWAAPVDGEPGSSGLAAHLYDA